MRTLVFGLCAVCAAVPLAAQRSIVYSSGPQGPSSLAALLRGARARGGSLVILNDAKGDFLKAVRPVLQAEDVMVLGPFLQTFGVETEGPGLQLRTREQWDAKPRWVVLDVKGRVAAHGTEVPDAKDLLKALQEAGIRGQADRLTAFLKEHPERHDVLQALLPAVQRVAAIRMRAFIEPPKPGTPPTTPQPLRLKPTYTGEQDERIWSDFARVLEGYVEAEAWGTEVGNMGPFLNAKLLALSPLMQDTSRRLLPTVAKALQRYPGHHPLWNVWLALREAGGGPEVVDFIASLAPLPGTRYFPSDDAVAKVVEGARDKQDWATIVKFMTPLWAAWKETKLELTGSKESVQQMSDMPWNEKIAPLVEAHLRLGNTTEAEKVVKEALDWSGTATYAAKAADLAKTCDQPGLAERWAKLDPKAK